LNQTGEGSKWQKNEKKIRKSPKSSDFHFPFIHLWYITSEEPFMAVFIDNYPDNIFIVTPLE
jgi:hypothetical protein